MSLDDYQGSLRVSIEAVMTMLGYATGRNIELSSDVENGDVVFMFMPPVITRGKQSEVPVYARVPRFDFARKTTERIFADVLQMIKHYDIVPREFVEPIIQQIENLPERVTDPDLENRFTYHPPKPGQPAQYERVRNAFKELAYLIKEECGSNRESSVALTNLETACFWANAAIARNGKGE